MKVFLCITLTLFLSACGGGGGSSNSGGETPSTPSTPPTSGGGGGETPPTPPTSGGGSGETPPTPPTSGGGGGETPPTPPTSGGGGETPPTPPTSGGGGETPPTPPTSGGGGETPPTPPTSGGEIPVITPDSMAGQLALKGISRIPINVGRLSNVEMRKRYLIVDSGGDSTHILRIRIVACLSYVVACEQSDPISQPFTQIIEGVRSTPPILNNKQQALIVASTRPSGREFYFAEDGGSGHVIVQGAGNDGTENFFVDYDYQEANDRFVFVATQQPVVDGINNAHLRIITATRDPNADKILYVAGSITDGSGRVVPHSSTTQCVTKYIEAHCLYAPFISQYPHPNGQGGLAILGGTSYSAQLVGAALASVWSIFPNTPPSQLLRLAKNCAKPMTGLNGLGLADFTCMTVPSGTGFRIVTQAELSSCVASKGRCLTSQGVNSLAFPGSTSIATNIGGLSFSRNKEGTFKTGNFTVGIPHQMGTSLLAKPWDVHLFGTGDAEEGSLGVVWENNKQMFVAAAFGVREEFFGLGSAQGYTDVHSLDGKLGHENFFARVSYQEAKGDSPLLEEARGTAIGFTLQDEFKLGLDSTLQLVLATDRFTGGVANTVFGRLKMDESEWNKSIQLAFDTSIAKNTVLSLNALNRWFDGQEDTTGTISLKKLL